MDYLIIFLLVLNVLHGLGFIMSIVEGRRIYLTNVIFQCVISYLLVTLVYHGYFESSRHLFKREKRKNYKRFEKKFGSVSIVKDVKAELEKNNYADFDVRVYDTRIETCGKTWRFSDYNLMDLDECYISSYDLARYFGYCVPFKMGCRVEALKKTLPGTGKVTGFTYNSSTGVASADYDTDSSMVIGFEVIGDNYKCDIPKKPTKQRWG